MFPDLELVRAFLDLELVFLALGLVLVFLALGQVQYLDPWLQLKQPNMEQEPLVEQVSQAVWQELDLLPQPPLPKLLPKLPSSAWEELSGLGPED